MTDGKSRRFLAFVAFVAMQSAVIGARAQGQSVESGAVAIALAEVREHGWTPRVVRTADAVVYPFGYAEPEMICAPLHACYVSLEPGERVTGIARCDAVRWKLDTLAQGGDVPRMLVVVKPTACDVATNLLIATDRRVYDVALRAPPCVGRAGTASAPTVRHVAFYFPDAARSGRVDSGSTAPPTVAAMPNPNPSAGGSPPAPPERLNFAYQWHAAKAVPWAPEQVYDDSAHVYIRLPETARFAAAPALWEIQPDGTRALLNYVLRDGTYKTDHIFDRAVLALGTGKNERTVEVMNARWRPDR